MLEAELPLERIYAADALSGIAGKIKGRGGQDDTGDPAGIAMSIAIGPLTIACRDEDANVRQEAVRALGTIGAPRSAADILAALQDTCQWVFSSAAEAAAKMKIPEVFDIFLEMFQEDLPDDGDRRLSSVISSLRTLGDQRACDFLFRCAESPHWGTKVEAAQALLALGDTRKWDFLVQALGDNDEDWTSYYRPGIAWAIAESGDPRAVDVLLENLEKIDKDSSMDEYLLVDLIESLASIGDPRAIEPIRRWQQFEFELREDVVAEAIRKLEINLRSH